MLTRASRASGCQSMIGTRESTSKLLLAAAAAGAAGGPVLGPDQPDHVRVAQPVRRGNDHLVARFAAGENGIEAGLLRAVADNDLVRLVIDIVVLGKFLADRGAQLGKPGARGVFGETFLQRLDRRFFDVLWRVEVGLTRSETADVDAFGPHGLGFAVNGESEGGGDLGDVGREIHKCILG